MNKIMASIYRHHLIVQDNVNEVYKYDLVCSMWMYNSTYDRWRESLYNKEIQIQNERIRNISLSIVAK